jgi:hypothetical protein
MGVRTPEQRRVYGVVDALRVRTLVSGKLGRRTARPLGALASSCYSGVVSTQSIALVAAFSVGPIAAAASVVAPDPSAFLDGTQSGIAMGIVVALWQLVRRCTDFLKAADEHRSAERDAWKAAADHRVAEQRYWDDVKICLAGTPSRVGPPDQ